MITKFDSELKLEEGQFVDAYGNTCVLEESAREGMIHFGLERTIDLRSLPRLNNQSFDVHLDSRMFLSRSDVTRLLPLLQRFVETGSLHVDKKEK